MSASGHRVEQAFMPAFRPVTMTALAAAVNLQKAYLDCHISISFALREYPSIFRAGTA
jgi:hypothetical protein